jgi:hypothetical protein
MGLLDSSGLSSTPTTSKTTTPSPDIQPYVKTVLDKGEALLNAGIPAYTGQMTAGPSEYQTQAWEGLANLSLPSNLTTAGQDLGNISQKAMDYRFDPNSVSQYMNPYIQQALDPQLAELRRQSQINLQPSLARLTQAGGYGGGRQAIMESEAGRNLLDLQTKYTGQGYKDAYDSAMKAAQYASDLGLRGLQQATSASQAQGNVGAQEASYGLQNLQALSAAGRTQQEQNQAAFNAQYNEWLRQQKYLPDMLKTQQGLIQGMPGGTQENTYTAKPSTLQSLVGSTTGVADIVKNMKAAGINMSTINSALKSMGIDLSKFRINPETGESLPPDMGTGNTNDSATNFNPPDYVPSPSIPGGSTASPAPDLDPGSIASLPPDLDSENYYEYTSDVD